MPTYQYRCKECDHDFEVVQSFSDDPLESCPECGGRLKKVYGNVGISFKGSGFYKTDSRGSSATSGASSSSGNSTDSGSGSTDTSSGGDAKKSDPSGDKKATTTSAAKD